MQETSTSRQQTQAPPPGFSFGLLFTLADGDKIFHENVRLFLNYMALQTGRL
jgi:hypothetical protein